MFNDRWASAKMELQSQDQNLTVHVEVEDWKGIPKHRINLSMHAFKPDDWGEHGLPIIRIQNLTQLLSSTRTACRPGPKVMECEP